VINGLIVSKNRACQLRLLLESISVNAPNLLNEILVIYTSSNENFERGYEKLQSEEILPNIIWQKEVDFIPDFLSALKNCKSKYICGVVDDCIFYKRVSSTPDQIENVMEETNAFCFSFRLGLNTSTQNYMNPSYYVPLQKYDENEFCVIWNWKEWSSKLNYGYPISLDGHVFRSKEISDLSHMFEFDRLRHWEGNVNGQCRDKVERNMMACYKQNVLFSIPANCVQDPPLVSGQIYSYSEEGLNEKYLNGEVIDLYGMEYAFQNVTWSHNEFEFKFKKL
tara:strand:+ start:2006 stop:2845 length:840 start_codon:yes stop_codon:yes gene_type:complete